MENKNSFNLANGVLLVNMEQKNVKEIYGKLAQ